MFVFIKILLATRRAVPFPLEMNGHCVYGHIITDKHINHFRLAYPDCPEWQSSDPESLVSVASVIIPGMHKAYTADVYDEQGEKQVCLIHVQSRNHSSFLDLRWSGKDDFMTALEKLLGVTGEPKWYPCKRPPQVEKSGDVGCHPETLP